VALTEAGQRYLQRCRQILADVDQAEPEAVDVRPRPSGHLRVYAMPGFGQTYLVPAIMRYQQRYPSVSVDLTLSLRVPDIIDEGFDVAIQMSSAPFPGSGVVSQRLGSLHSVLCASPGYLRDNGTPDCVAGLLTTRAYSLSRFSFRAIAGIWTGPHGRETFELPPTAFQVNIPDGLSAALREGKGIGAMPISSAVPALKNSSLVRVLPGHQLQRLTAYVLYSSRQYLDAKIGTFVEFLRDTVPQALAADQATLS